MAKAFVTAAALAGPCSAFLQGNLRSHQSLVEQRLSDVQLGADAPETSRLSGCGVGTLSIAAVGVAAAAVLSRSTGRAARVQRNVVGVCRPVTEKFDPLNLASTDAKMDRYTAVEIKNGRVAMLAVLGYIIPENFRFPGCEGFENGLGALTTIPLEGWVQLVAMIGAHEVLVKPRQGGLGSWDFGFGSEVLEGIPADELEYRQTSERNNGRLAMVAIMGLMIQDGLYGKTPIAFLQQEGWWGPSVNFIVKDIPVCMGTIGCAQKPASRGPGLTAMRAMNATTQKSPSVPFLRYPDQLEGWVGGEKGFDPLGVTDALPVYLCREAEIKHGRVCMFATVGWIATDLGIRFPGEVFQNLTTINAHDKLVEANIMGPFLAALAVVEVFSGWLLLEGFEGKIKRDAGVFWFGWNFYPKDAEGKRAMDAKEIENGRLAMFAFSGIVTQAVLTGKTWPFV